MLIVADTHVHVYRGYDVAVALRHGLRNLTGLARRCGEGGEDPELKDTLLALFLAEAQGSHLFEDLRQGRLEDQLAGWSIEPAGEDCALWVKPPEPTARDSSAPDAERFLLVAGRQLVTEERLEVLALATDADLPRTSDLQAAIEAVRGVGGVPVLSWAPGKWSFQRGEMVASVIEASSPGVLLIGDSSLRSRASEPSLMVRARQRGLKVVAGSDPLPIHGEERILGSYGIAWHGEVEMGRSVDSLRRMLLNPDIPVALVGKRSSSLGVVSRLARHTMAKKLGRSNG